MTAASALDILRGMEVLVQSAMKAGLFIHWDIRAVGIISTFILVNVLSLRVHWF